MLQWLSGRSNNEQQRQDMLRAIPVQNPRVERTVLADGRLILRGQTRLNGWQRLMGGRSALRQFEIDTLGDWVWRHCQGDLTVEELVRGFGLEHAVNLREAEIAVVSFLNMLAKRNVVAFVVGRRKSVGGRRRRKRS